MIKINSFILSNLKIEGFEEIEILDGVFIRKAKKYEIIKLKEKLNEYPIPGLSKESRKYYFEHERVRTDNSTIETILSKEEDYKYWIVEIDNKCDLVLFYYSLKLLKNSFELGFRYIFDDEKPEKLSFLGNDYVFFKYMKLESIFSDNFTINIKMDEIKTLKEIYEKLVINYNKYDFIEHAFRNFDMLKYVDETSDLVILGYFSIIEMLITHPPRLNESLDSISHQIVNKINLLEKMFHRNINYHDYFKDTKKETIWKKLYAYRSDIAHGNVMDFDRKFELLISKENINKFLIENIKNILLFSIYNTDFINDLKKC